MKCFFVFVFLLIVTHTSNQIEVDITFNESIVCRGLLVSQKVVLTNFNCVKGYLATYLLVVFSDDSMGEVERVVQNPNNNDGEKYNDLAVLVLKEPQDDYTQPEQIDYEGTSSNDCIVNWHTLSQPKKGEKWNIFSISNNTGGMTLNFLKPGINCDKFVKSLNERGVAVACSGKLTGILSSVHDFTNVDGHCAIAQPIFTRLGNLNKEFVQTQIFINKDDQDPLLLRTFEDRTTKTELPSEAPETFSSIEPKEPTEVPKSMATSALVFATPGFAFLLASTTLLSYF